MAVELSGRVCSVRSGSCGSGGLVQIENTRWFVMEEAEGLNTGWVKRISNNIDKSAGIGKELVYLSSDFWNLCIILR